MMRKAPPPLSHNSFPQFCSPASEDFVALAPLDASSQLDFPEVLSSGCCSSVSTFILGDGPHSCARPCFPDLVLLSQHSPKHLAASQFLLEALLSSPPKQPISCLSKHKLQR